MKFFKNQDTIFKSKCFGFTATIFQWDLPPALNTPTSTSESRHNQKLKWMALNLHVFGHTSITEITSKYHIVIVT